MIKLFLGFVVLGFMNSLSQTVFADVPRCDLSDIEKAEQILNKRERLVEKGLALYSNPRELEELNRNFESARGIELVSKGMFITSVFTIIAKTNETSGSQALFSRDVGGAISMTASMIGGGALFFGSMGELIRYAEKKSVAEIDVTGSGFKAYDDVHHELTRQRQLRTDEFEGFYGRFKNSVTLGSAGTDAQWALRMEYVGHAAMYEKELEYIKVQRVILEKAKLDGVCERNEDITHSASAVNERQQLIDAIDEVMDFKKATERSRTEANLI